MPTPYSASRAVDRWNAPVSPNIRQRENLDQRYMPGYGFTDKPKGKRRGNLLSMLLDGTLGDLGPDGLLDLLGGGIDWTRSGKGDDVDFASKVPEEWSGQSSTPDPYEEGDPLLPTVNPEEAIRSQRPRIIEEMQRNMASAAQRLGQAGVPTSSGGYATKLGQASRKATSDIGEIIARHTLRAREQEAQREFEGDQARRQRQYGAWGTEGGWEMGAGQNDLERALRAWGKHGDWTMRAGEQDLQAALGRETRGDERFRMLLPLLRASLEGGV
jgi:hypothetical protein